MSQENIELVRAVHERWARGDFALDAGLLSSDFRWEQHADAVEAGSRSGAEIGRSLRNIFEVYADYRIEAEDFIEAGEQVVVPGRARGTARASGMELDQGFTFVWTVREGRLARLRVFTDRDEALGSAGLRG